MIKLEPYYFTCPICSKSNMVARNKFRHDKNLYIVYVDIKCEFCRRDFYLTAPSGYERPGMNDKKKKDLMLLFVMGVALFLVWNCGLMHGRFS